MFHSTRIQEDLCSFTGNGAYVGSSVYVLLTNIYKITEKTNSHSSSTENLNNCVPKNMVLMSQTLEETLTS